MREREQQAVQVWDCSNTYFSISSLVFVSGTGFLYFSDMMILRVYVLRYNWLELACRCQKVTVCSHLSEFIRLSMRALLFEWPTLARGALGLLSDPETKVLFIIYDCPSNNLSS